MAVSRTAWVDSELAVHTLDRATVRGPYGLVPGPVTDQGSWARVIRHARCADPDVAARSSPGGGSRQRRKEHRATQQWSALACVLSCSARPLRAPAMSVQRRGIRGWGEEDGDEGAGRVLAWRGPAGCEGVHAVRGPRAAALQGRGGP